MYLLLLASLSWAQDNNPSSAEELPEEAPVDMVVPRHNDTVPDDIARGDLFLVAGGRAYTAGFAGAPSVRLGVGYRLPVLGDRLRLGFEFGWARPAVRGLIIDERLDVPADWQVVQHQAHMAAEIVASLSDPRMPLRIEIAAAPELTWMRTSSRTELAGVDAGLSIDENLTLAGRLTGGFAGSLGPGEAIVHVGVQAVPQSDTITGSALSVGLGLHAGYRVRLF